MTIAQIKKQMLEYRDFFGGDIMYTDEIEKATTKKQLNELLDRYSGHLEMVAVDAQSHLNNFRIRLNINGY
jgi:hypothetical protein